MSSHCSFIFKNKRTSRMDARAIRHLLPGLSCFERKVISLEAQREGVVGLGTTSPSRKVIGGLFLELAVLVSTSLLAGQTHNYYKREQPREVDKEPANSLTSLPTFGLQEHSGAKRLLFNVWRSVFICNPKDDARMPGFET
jgi:hypothetical protein